MNKEDALQIACVTWFKCQFPNVTIFHPKNGGSFNAIEGAKFKKMGVLPGVPDLFIMRAKNGFNGMFIELKVDKNTQTDSQKEFERKALMEGFTYLVVRSVDEFMQICNDYLT
jgi:hypothetical protein